MTRPTPRPAAGSRRPSARLPAALAGLLVLAHLATVPVAAQDASLSPVPDAQASTMRVELPAAGAAIALPADWLVVDLAADPGGTAFGQAHPELAGLLADVLATGPMNAVAFAPTAEGDALPTVFALFRGPNMGMTPESMLTLTTSALPQLPGVLGDITSEELTLGGEPGFRVGYDWQLPRAEGTRTQARVEQFTVMRPSVLWVFSFTDDQPAADAWVAAAGTFELLE